jgi:hypothetical protein
MTHWTDHAECRNHPPDTFLLPDRAKREPAAKVAHMKMICRSCSVIEECREWILVDDVTSAYPVVAHVVAALTPADRIDVRNRRKVQL